jgi:hypothetical protein
LRHDAPWRARQIVPVKIANPAALPFYQWDVSVLPTIAAFAA